MSRQILTLAHEFHVQQNYAVLEAAGGVPVVDSLDAATDQLDAVVDGLRELMTVPACSHMATLLYYAADSALSLVYAAHAGVEAFEAQANGKGVIDAQ